MFNSRSRPSSEATRHPSESSTDGKTLALYLVALQSQRIEIKGPDQRKFLVPSDLIYKRSEYVRKALEWQHEDKGEFSIDFTQTPIRTLEHFIVWTYAAQPTVPRSMKLDDVVELAIFAETHFFEALHNQALDRLREKLASAEWRLEPQVVERVYRLLHSQTPLRRMFRVLLQTAHTEVHDDEERRKEAMVWATVFEGSFEIGRDYYLASCEGYTTHQVLSGGPCRFHWHRDFARKDLNQTGDNACPLAFEACFVNWNEFIVSREVERHE